MFVTLVGAMFGVKAGAAPRWRNQAPRSGELDSGFVPRSANDQVGRKRNASCFRELPSEIARSAVLGSDEGHRKRGGFWVRVAPQLSGQFAPRELIAAARCRS